MRERLAAMERTFSGKVLVVSEFGAESNDLNPPGAPGSYAYQAQLLAEHIAVYEADPHLTAMMVWVLRDYPLDPHVLGRLDQTGAAEAEANRRPQPEGPFHIWRPGQAGRGEHGGADVQSAAGGIAPRAWVCQCGPTTTWA